MKLSKEREDEIRKQLSSLFDGMMQTLYSLKGAEFRIEVLAKPKVQEFIDAHAEVLDSGFRQVEMSEAMRRRLTRSDYIFSGMKTFHELNEAFPSLLDENGNRKPFEQFLNDVRKIDETYNSNYLRAEYNFVQSSAEMAAKWEQFMEDGDRYNLQYRTARDGKVRPEHAALHGVTLPVTDSFWEEYYPPNGWNCFTKGTPVLTAEGWKPIETIRKGDSVIGGSGQFRIVIGTHAKTVDEEIVRIITKGAVATCTENHRFCTPHGWVTAARLDAGDIIIQVGKNSALHKIVNAICNTHTLLRHAVVGLRKTLADILAAFRCSNPLGTHGIASMTGRDIRLTENAGHSSVVHAPMGGKPAEVALLGLVTPFCGITDIHAFNGFNSFLDFLRHTFFHNRYVLVEGKVNTKKSETTVFNLSIDRDEAYIVPVGITHNCRCTVVQVRKSKYPATPHDEAMALGEEALQRDSKGIFHFNAGKEQKTVPDYNPYTIRRCRDCDVAKGKLELAFVPDNELCAACKLLNKCAGDRTKTQRAIERTHYLHEMEPLLKKSVTKTAGDKSLNVGFTKYGNSHLFSDTFGRSRILSKDDLKDLGDVLSAASFVEDAPLTHPRTDGIERFYYFKAQIRGQWVRLNVAKQVLSQPNGKKQLQYFLYSINDIKSKSTEGGS